MKLIYQVLFVLLFVQSLFAEDIIIKKAATLPSSTPWNLAELSKSPKFKWTEDKGVRSLYYESEKYKEKVTKVFAYYATPGTLSGDKSKDKKLPAVVLVHGGGGMAFSKWAKLWASRGYAAIAMDLGGKGPNKSANLHGGPGQGDKTKFGSFSSPATDQWTYHAVANVIRAHSLILSFPEVDKTRTAITGISWGGYLTCIVSGLDNRFKAAVPVYGCGFLHENSFWLKQFRAMTPEYKTKWVTLWDPSQYAGSAQMPVFYVNGGNDFAYPPDSHAKTYGLVKSEKNLHFVPDLRHGHIFDKPKSIEVYINSRLKGGVPLAKIGLIVAKGSQVIAKVESKTKLSKAQMHYSIDQFPGNPKSRKWLSVDAKIEKEQILAPKPENATVYFLTVTDERDTTVSSSLVFPMK
jgi:cephalosporin-C deacetylase-like acetyl esterase